VECKRAEPKDSMSAASDSVAAALGGGAMMLAQAADGSLGLVPASALHHMVAPTVLNAAAVGPGAGGVGLLSSADLSAAAAAYRSQDLLQQSLLPTGQSVITSYQGGHRALKVLESP